MDGGAARTTLVDNINTAFSSANIAESVARLERLSPRADFLSISRELGILGDMDEPTFRRYRRTSNTADSHNHTSCRAVS
jgi:hypothetical protein